MDKIKKLDPIRKARQVLIIKKWIKNGCIGTLEAATGFGKTIVAIMIINQFQKESIEPILVIVPTLFLQKQWYDELENWKLTGVTVLVVNTAVKSDHKVGLLILDEIHMYTAPVFKTVFDRVNYQKILGLTATLRETDVKNLLIHQNAPIVDVVSLEEALTNRWVSAFKIYNCAVPMTQTEITLYTKYTKDFNRYFSFFNHDFDLAMSCLKSRVECDRWGKALKRSGKDIKIYAVQFVRNMRLRKDLLYKLPSKLKIAQQIIEMFPSRKIITFSQSIESAENLQVLIGSDAVVYHSSMKGHIGINGKKMSGKKARQDAVDRFISDNFMVKCRILCTAKALDMGADIPEIDMALIISGTATAVQGLQRYGRSIRYIVGKETIIVELYAPETQDERWLKSRQKKVPKSSIRWISSVSEIQ